MDRGEDEVIIVLVRRVCVIAGGAWRIERQFRQKPLARRISGCDLLKLDDVCLTRLGVLILPFEMGFVPEPCLVHFCGPVSLSCTQSADDRNEPVPVIPDPWR